jgi:hypothetical protein
VVISFRRDNEGKNMIMSYQGQDKVKVALVQALRLCTSRTDHRGSRGIALLFRDHGTRKG